MMRLKRSCQYLFERLRKEAHALRFSAIITVASYTAVSCINPFQGQDTSTTSSTPGPEPSPLTVAERIEEEYSNDLSEAEITDLESIIEEYHSGRLAFNVETPFTLAWNPPSTGSTKEYNLFVREKDSEHWLYLATTSGMVSEDGRNFDVSGHPRGDPFEGAYEFAVDAVYSDGRTSELHKSFDEDAEPSPWYAIIGYAVEADVNGDGTVTTDELVDYILQGGYEPYELTKSVDSWYADMD